MFKKIIAIVLTTLVLTSSAIAMPQHYGSCSGHRRLHRMNPPYTNYYRPTPPPPPHHYYGYPSNHYHYYHYHCDNALIIGGSMFMLGTIIGNNRY